MKKISLLLLSTFLSGNVWATDVSGIAVKSAGGSVSITDFNTIIEVIKGFFTDNTVGSEKLVIGSGVGGIGDRELEVNSPLFTLKNATIPQLIVNDTTNNVGARLYADDNFGFVGTATNHPFRIQTNNSTKLYIKTDGNVGIGNTTPATTLDVTGTVTALGYAGGNVSNWDTAYGWGDHGAAGYLTPTGDGSGLTGIAAGGKFVDGTVTSDAVYTGGNVGIGITTPTTKLEVSGTVTATAFVGGNVSNWDTAYGWGDHGAAGYAKVGNANIFTEDQTVNGAFLVSGITGSTPTLGAGTRMMFIPAKGAFRAGKVSFDEWDDSNIGSYSVGMGDSVKATGKWSTAIGTSTTATQDASTAMGYFTTSSGQYSTSMGKNTTASGEGATSMGFNTTASGWYSVAMGDNTQASNTNSISMGSSTQASGTSSVAMGNGTIALGQYSTAMGYGTTASEWAATAIGQDTTASGQYSIATGIYATASGSASTAMGQSTTALGQYSTAMGYGTTASGQSAIAMGGNTTALENWSTAMGSGTMASGSYSTAMGRNTEASGWYSTAMGYNTTASGSYSLAIGNASLASGSNSLATGWATRAIGSYSTALGIGTDAEGYISTAMGKDSRALGSISTAIGNWTTASGDYSTSMGHKTTAQSYASTVLGRYNIISGTIGSWIDTEPIFVIGNGTSSVQSNAMTVLKNGNVGIGVTNPTTRLEINSALNGSPAGLKIDFETRTYTENSIAAIDVVGTGALGTVFKVEAGGNVGIGNTAPTEKLVVAGNVVADSYLYNSDKNLKEAIKPINGAIEKIEKLNGVSFDWKKDGRSDIGVIAQEVEMVFPELVKTNEKTGMKSVDYASLVAPLIEAVKEQQNKIKLLELKINELAGSN